MEMELIAKIVSGFKLLTIFPKPSILHVWHGSEYALGVFVWLSRKVFLTLGNLFVVFGHVNIFFISFLSYIFNVYLFLIFIFQYLI